MLLLLVFAVIAGAGTAITPCVLPVLPALLSASAVGGRRRPLGIVTGLAVTFTIAIVALAELVNGVGLASGATRILAIVILIAFGCLMLMPALAQRIQAPLSRLARFGPKTRGDGFWTGLGVGGALGFVCAPCAGPILSAVTAVSASTGPTVRVVLVGLAYSAGLSTVMLLYGLGGRAVLTRIRRATRGHVVERTLGVVLLATGLAMTFNLDVRFEDVLAGNGVPSFLRDPTNGLETSSAVQGRLSALRPPSKFAERKARAVAARTGGLPELGRAPEFTDTQDWFNTAGDRPLTLARLRGKVVLIDFWTYTCINCIRTLPFVEGLYSHYRRFGLEVVGVETPEFTFEQQASNVRQAIRSDGITYPVVQDNRYGTWDAYTNQYWPAEYFVDARGNVRHTQFGEGNYGEDETVVRDLLAAAGARHLPARMTARALAASGDLESLETYLSPERADQSTDPVFITPIDPGTHNYKNPEPGAMAINDWALNGRWTAGQQSIAAAAGSQPGSASVSGGVQARDVYLVMTSQDGRPRTGRVLLDGKPIPAADRGTDVRAGGYFTVTQQRLYNLVKLRQDARFTITVEPGPGIDAYDFTFG